MGGNARYIRSVSAADYKRARDDLSKRYRRILANKYVQEAGHTAKAFAQGAESAVHDIGSAPVSIVNNLSGGKLAKKSKTAAMALAARNEAASDFDREMNSINSEALKVAGSLGYYVPDIVIGQGAGALGKGARVTMQAGIYGGRRWDENLQDGMEPAAAAVNAAMKGATTAVLGNANAAKTLPKNVIKNGSLGVVDNVADNAAYGATGKYNNMKLWSADEQQAAVFNLPKMKESFVNNAFKGTGINVGRGKSGGIGKSNAAGGNKNNVRKSNSASNKNKSAPKKSSGLNAIYERIVDKIYRKNKKKNHR